MEKIGISIIIPVYNAALYIDKCLASVLEQSFSSFEVICVDDGSSDASVNILKSLAQKDDRIKIICQENQGAGAARNLGLQQADGQYLLFLDADDFFAPNMLQRLWDVAEEKNADIVVCNADKYDTINKVFCDWSIIDYYPSGQDIFASEDIPDDIFNFTVSAPWNKLFRREFVLDHDLFFQNIKSSNDLAFVYSALACCSRIAIIDETFVHYRVNNPNSLQGSSRKDTLDAFRALACLNDFLCTRKMSSAYANSFCKLVGDIGIYTLANIPLERFKQEITSRNLLDYLLSLLDINSGKNVEFGNCDVLVYGAGQQATVLIRCLVELLGVNKKKIKVAVSSVTGTEKTEYDISVREITKCSNSAPIKLVVSASRESSRLAMVENAQNLGYEDITYYTDVEVLRFCYLLGSGGI